MKNTKWLLFISFTLLFCSTPFSITHNLPGGARLDIKLPSGNRHPSKCAMLIIPGGSYHSIVMENEGLLPAQKCNDEGMPAFILSYHTRTMHPVPLHDAEEAMEFIRSNADKYEIDQRRVGVMGFSAGGHLSATLCTLGKDSTMPYFALLFYPIISMFDSVTHAGSRNNIIGSEAPDSLKMLLSCNLQVTASTPPTFITHGDADKTVSIKNSQMYYDAFVAAGVLAVFHTEKSGIHGYDGDVYDGTTWIDEYQTFFESVLNSNVTKTLEIGNTLLTQKYMTYQKSVRIKNNDGTFSFVNLLGKREYYTPDASGLSLIRIIKP